MATQGLVEAVAAATRENYFARCQETKVREAAVAAGWAEAKAELKDPAKAWNFGDLLNETEGETATRVEAYHDREKALAAAYAAVVARVNKAL